MKKSMVDAPEQNPKARLATQVLDVFTKVWCVRDGAGPKFECKGCPFRNVDGKCRVRMFWRNLCPDYKDFGAMTH